MTEIDLHDALRGKWEDGTRPADLFEQRISKRPAAHVDVLVAGLASKEKRVQGGCAELCSRLSALEPALLAPHLATFVANLGSKAPILRWEAVCTLGNLSAIAPAATLDAIVEPMIAFLADESIVLQGHAVRALVKVAAARPGLAPRILDALIAARPHFAGNRVGFLVEAMEAFAASRALAPRARDFVEAFVESGISSVKTKARRARKRFEIARG